MEDAEFTWLTFGVEDEDAYKDMAKKQKLYGKGSPHLNSCSGSCEGQELKCKDAASVPGSACTNEHDERDGETSEDKCVAMQGCKYDASNGDCSSVVTYSSTTPSCSSEGYCANAHAGPCNVSAGYCSANFLEARTLGDVHSHGGSVYSADAQDGWWTAMFPECRGGDIYEASGFSTLDACKQGCEDYTSCKFISFGMGRCIFKNGQTSGHACINLAESGLLLPPYPCVRNGQDDGDTKVCYAADTATNCQQALPTWPPGCKWIDGINGDNTWKLGTPSSGQTWNTSMSRDRQ